MDSRVRLDEEKRKGKEKLQERERCNTTLFRKTKLMDSMGFDQKEGGKERPCRRNRLKRCRHSQIGQIGEKVKKRRGPGTSRTVQCQEDRKKIPVFSRGRERGCGEFSETLKKKRKLRRGRHALPKK